MITIKHVPGDTNDADIFMKNVMSSIFNCHVPSIVCGTKQACKHVRMSIEWRGCLGSKFTQFVMGLVLKI